MSDDDKAFALAQLRHAYAQLKAGTVKDLSRFADGLIGRSIAKLEQYTPARPTIGQTWTDPETGKEVIVCTTEMVGNLTNALETVTAMLASLRTKKGK